MQKSFAEQVQVTQKLTDQLNILEEAFQENSSAVDLAKRMASRSQIWLERMDSASG